MALTDFTLSNARRFYSSMGNPLGLKGLTTRKAKNYVPVKKWQQLPGCVFPWSALVLQVQIFPGIPTEVSANPHLCVAFWWIYPSPQNKGPKKKWWRTFKELLNEYSLSRDGNKSHCFMHRSAQFHNWQSQTKDDMRWCVFSYVTNEIFKTFKIRFTLKDFVLLWKTPPATCEKM